MKTMNRSNLIWPVLIIGIGIIMLLISANILPEAIGDLLIRSWPVLLIIFGLNVLLSQRLPYANWLVLGLAIVLVVVVANIAYAERRGEYRTDYNVSVRDEIPPDATSVVVIIDIRETRATISPSAESRRVEARFEGSNESDVDIKVDMEAATAIVTITEKRPGVLPRLSEVGRGTLNVFLPIDVPIESIDYLVDDGSLTADLREFTVRSINFHLKRGNMKLCLPSEGVVLQDAIQIDKGNLTVVVVPNTPLRFNLGQTAKEPTFIPPTTANDYQLLLDGSLETRLAQNFRILLNVVIEGGLTLDHTDSCGS